MVQLCARHPGACRRSPCAGLLHKRRVCYPARRDFGVATGNISQRVRDKLGRNLHLTTGHPLNTIKRTIEQHFEKQQGDTTYAFFDSIPPQVSVKSNFDDLLIPPDHPSREPTDTFYLDDGQVLRTHTSAHQVELMQAGHRAFLCTGDVYRRDTVDRTHYPVFHQTEGLRIFEEWGNGEDACERVEEDMRHTLNGLARALFGDVPTRWNPDYFPFTEPSWELEILFNGEWTEVLGCGVVRQEILQSCGHGHARAWAFGLGLERLAMILFNIPDIRLFWSEDSRFNDQCDGPFGTKFKHAQPGVHETFPTFVPYSKYPECYKDVSFWLPQYGTFHENFVHEVVREVGGDLVEEVVLQDAFTHPTTGRVSHCYRINYRSLDRSLRNEEIDNLQWDVRTRLEDLLGVELR